MKIRILDNAIRLRLDRSEVSEIGAGRSLVASTHFASGRVFGYQLTATETASEAEFDGSAIVLKITKAKLLAWAADEYQVGIRESLPTANHNLELLIEKEVKVKNQPDNLYILLGAVKNAEDPGQTTNLNIFSSALTVDQIKSQTRPGEKECGLEGDFLSWEKSLEEEQWTLHSKARWVDLDGGHEGPCRKKAKMNIFTMNETHYQNDCMKHCEKLGGRSPSVKRKKEWEDLWKEVKAVSPDPLKIPARIWLSATEGDKEGKLGKLDHWPEGVEAKEFVWRDYYTGEQLENYTKPWMASKGDKEVGEAYNCIIFKPTRPETRTWKEWQCVAGVAGCPCTYDSPPLIHLRGFCPDTLLENKRYTFTQSPADPNNIIMVGSHSARIQYNSSLSQWVYVDPRLNVTARSRASQNSFVLGKHNWTISGDRFQCFEGKEYTREMKLTGCKNTQFTCDDGQCVMMEERCNQVPDCEDESDEMNCKILVLKRGYNKRVPPLGKINGTLKPVEVNLSLTLFKVVAIEEEDHSIQLQFQINLDWKENRATYHNLKSESYLNALSQDEINSLWLPLVVYLNTDQQETTRLGVEWEWSTYINVKTEGNFTRSGYKVSDETYLFRGDENSLMMTQSYTHEFQCVYQLQRYPFDTQVGKTNIKFKQ